MSTEKEELQKAAEEAGILIPEYEFNTDITDINSVLNNLSFTQEALMTLIRSTSKQAEKGNVGAIKLLLKLTEQLQMTSTASASAIKARNGFKKANVEVKLKHRQQLANENRDNEEAMFSSEMLKTIQDLVKRDPVPGEPIKTTLDDDSLTVTGETDENSEDEADNLIEKQLEAANSAKVTENEEEIEETSVVVEGDVEGKLELMASTSGKLYTFNTETGEIKPYFFENTDEQVVLDVEIDEKANEYIVFFGEQRISVYEIDEK